MKLLNVFSIMIIFSSCASNVRYSNNDATTAGIHIALGSKDGIKQGDQIRVLHLDCNPNGRVRTCIFNTIGFLKVTEVHGDNSLIAQRNDKIQLDDSIYFEKM